MGLCMLKNNKMLHQCIWHRNMDIINLQCFSSTVPVTMQIPHIIPVVFQSYQVTKMIPSVLRS